MKRLLPVAWGFASFFWLSYPAFAQATRSIPASYARGEHQIVPIALYRGSGVTLNFRPTGETIRRVWLDDPSQLTVDFDDSNCLVAGSAQGECAASVIHLRRIHPLNFPHLPSTAATTLTVLTDQDEYKFQLTFPNSGIPSYYTLEIQPDRSNLTSPAIATAVQGQSGARLIEQGLTVAQSRGAIAPGDALWNRLQSLIALLRRGVQVDSAARQVGVSPALIARLMELGR